ncbi:Protein CBG25337 [Caenorhabditis briggsae]|nr:Protein CBG25337 [Caenorhabditis briggsae]CAR99531.1 Protein CBG25337 [Caenorhabditis briggsae]
MLHEKKKRKKELKGSQDEMHKYKERDEGRKQKMEVLVHEKNLMKKQI